MLYTFEIYEGHVFVGTKTVEADTELLATVDLDCELEEEGRGHLEYDLLEEGSLAQMCAEIELQQKVEDEQFMSEIEDEYLVPWSNAKVGDKLNTAIGEDCSLCPEESQYKIKAGCFVKGRPCCQWCAHTDELGEKYMSGEISPMSPEDIAKQSGVCSKRTKK